MRAVCWRVALFISDGHCSTGCRQRLLAAASLLEKRVSDTPSDPLDYPGALVAIGDIN